MPLTYNYFGVFIDGNTRHYAAPDPPAPHEARPFVVRLGTNNPGGTNVILLNVLVFARDGEHAKGRVIAALEECCQKTQHVHIARQHILFNDYLHGYYELQCEPLDTSIMPGIEFAVNGGL
jgi:hypothetical protein